MRSQSKRTRKQVAPTSVAKISKAKKKKRNWKTAGFSLIKFSFLSVESWGECQSDVMCGKCLKLNTNFLALNVNANEETISKYNFFTWQKLRMNPDVMRSQAVNESLFIFSWISSYWRTLGRHKWSSNAVSTSQSVRHAATQPSLTPSMLVLMLTTSHLETPLSSMIEADFPRW